MSATAIPATVTAVASAIVAAVVMGTMRIVTFIVAIRATEIGVSRPRYRRSSGNQIRQNSYDDAHSDS